MAESEAITRGVRVRAQSIHDPQRSDPLRDRWFFLYTIRITNESQETVQLLSRHWIITDAMGRVDEVRGAGVVGEQPVLEPGQSFEYTSGCPLPTPMGSMRGSYQMRTTGDARFEVEIAPFELAEPAAIH